MPWRGRRNRPHGRPTTGSTLIRRLAVDIPIAAARRRVGGRRRIPRVLPRLVVIVTNRPCNVARICFVIARPVGVIGRHPWRRRGQIAADSVRPTEPLQRFDPGVAIGEDVGDNLVDLSGFVDQEIAETGELPPGFRVPATWRPPA
jgi:hypothetical protein